MAVTDSWDEEENPDFLQSLLSQIKPQDRQAMGTANDIVSQTLASKPTPPTIDNEVRSLADKYADEPNESSSPAEDTKTAPEDINLTDSRTTGIPNQSAQNPVTQYIQQKYGFGPGMDQQALMDAQKGAQDDTNRNNLFQAAQTVGNALSHRPNDPSFYNNLNAQAQQPVKNIGALQDLSQANYKMSQEQESADPNSSENKAFQAFSAKLMHMDPNDPAITGLNIAGNGKLTTMLADTYFKAKEMGESRRQSAQMHADAQQAIQRTTADAKTSKTQTDAFNKVNTMLNGRSSDPAAKQAELDLYNAKKADGLANMYGDPNKLSPQQARLYISEISKIATGGVPSDSEMKALESGSITGELAKVWGRISNKPQPANAGDFIKSYQDYSAKLKQEAQRVIQERYGRLIESNKKHLSDDDYQSLQDQYINRFKDSSPQPQQPQGGGNDLMQAAKDELAKRGIQ